jgi:hypothetical protein
LPGHLELLRELRRKRLHAERFRGVVAAVEDVQSELLGQRKAPVRRATSGARLVSAVLSSLTRRPSTPFEFSKPYPIEPRQAHVPFSHAPPRRALHRVLGRPAGRSVHAVVLLPRQGATSVRLGLLWRWLSSSSSPSPSGWRLLRAWRITVVLSSSSPSLMLGLGERRAARLARQPHPLHGLSVTRSPIHKISLLNYSNDVNRRPFH